MVAIVGGTIYGVSYEIDHYKNKHYSEPTEQENKSDESLPKALNLDDALVVSLMEPIHALNSGLLYDYEQKNNTFFGYWYQQERYTVDTISNQVKLYLALNSLKDSTWKEVVQVSQADVESAVKKLFGKTATVTHESLNGVGCNYTHFAYDTESKIYQQENPQCGSILPPHFLTKVERATLYSDRIEIIEKMAYIDYSEEVKEDVIGNVYSNQNQTSIGTFHFTEEEALLFDTYTDQLNSYKYVFRIENGNYYLDSIELVK